MEKHYWMHRIESDIPAAIPLLRRGYLSVGWSNIATSNDDVLCLAREKGRTKLRRLTDYSSFNDQEFVKLENFAQFAPDDIVVVPLSDDKLAIYEIEEAPKSITKCIIPPYIDTESYNITQAENGLLLRNIDEYRMPTVIDIGFVVRVRALTPAISRQDMTSEQRRKVFLRPTNNNIDGSGAVIENIIKEFA